MPNTIIPPRYGGVPGGNAAPQHRNYNLPGVKLHVKQAADSIGNRFAVTTILGLGLRPDLTSDHPKGLALDFMVGNSTVKQSSKDKGDALAEYVRSNAGAYGVTYVIWRQRIWSLARSGEGWRPMPDRGSLTANHFDHVHVSFQPNAPKNTTIDDAITGVVTDPIDKVKGLIDAVGWLTHRENLLRIAMFIGGGALLLVGLVGWAGASTMGKTAISSMAKAGKVKTA